jgi:hypothetical protein
MTRRRSNVLPLRPGASNKPITTRPLSDRERLVTEKFLAAQDSVIAQANAAADVFIRLLMREAGLEVDEGWMFNRHKMRWEKHPVPADA